MLEIKEHHISTIELNRLHNQWLIDNDYIECKECGKISHDLYCGEHVCECQFEDRTHDMVKFFESFEVRLQPWQIELLDRINRERDKIIKEFKVPLSMVGVRDDLDTHIDPMGFPCRIVSTPFGDRISFGCRIIGGIDYGREDNHE